MNTITSLTKATPFRIDDSQAFSSDEVLSEFFDMYDLHNVQNHMWEMFKLVYVGKHKDQPAVERQNLISFYEHLYDFLTMSFLSNQARKQELNKP